MDATFFQSSDIPGFLTFCHLSPRTLLVLTHPICGLQANVSQAGGLSFVSESQLGANKDTAQSSVCGLFFSLFRAPSDFI